MPLNVYWWRPEANEPLSADPYPTLARRFPEGRTNFGDELAPLILDQLGYSWTRARWAQEADLVCVGSLLSLLRTAVTPEGPRITAWGCGFLADGLPRSFPERVSISATRGYLSAKQAMIENPVVGDGALVLQHPRVERRFVGVIPHYLDQDKRLVTPIVSELAEGYPVKVIDVWDPPAKVLEEIASCFAVVSSSLHGLVVSDALGVPNVWVKLSDHLAGENYKFKDYYSAFGLYVTPIEGYRFTMQAFNEALEDYDRSELDQIQERLVAAFP